MRRVNRLALIPLSRFAGLFLAAGTILAAYTLNAGPARAGEPDGERGLSLAKEHCARCHVIGDGRTMNGIGSTPSFPSMVRFMDDWSERFATFFERPPHPAFVRLKGREPPTGLPANASPVLLDDQDALDLHRYAEELQRRLTTE